MTTVKQIQEYDTEESKTLRKIFGEASWRKKSIFTENLRESDSVLIHCVNKDYPNGYVIIESEYDESNQYSWCWELDDKEKFGKRDDIIMCQYCLERPALLLDHHYPYGNDGNICQHCASYLFRLPMFIFSPVRYLPDVRGTDQFARMKPQYEKYGLTFEE